MAQIIDWEQKGNVVRFYLGETGNTSYWGDDWDDVPYEHNAGRVYDEFITGIHDKVFPFDWDVESPENDWPAYQGNSPFCKDDFKERKAPCIVAAPHDPKDWRDPTYTSLALRDDAVKFFFGDELEPTGTYIPGNY